MSKVVRRHFIHLVWSTRGRSAVIDAVRAEFVHETIAAQCSRLDCGVIAVSTSVDHAHLLCRVSPKVPVMELVRATKSASSVLFNRAFGADVLRWQEGYGEFSVSPWDVAAIAEYVKTQRSRHESGEVDQWLEDVPRGDKPADQPLANTIATQTSAPVMLRQRRSQR
jgi:putative transposase